MSRPCLVPSESVGDRSDQTRFIEPVVLEVRRVASLLKLQVARAALLQDPRLRKSTTRRAAIAGHRLRRSVRVYGPRPRVLLVIALERLSELEPSSRRPSVEPLKRQLMDLKGDMDIGAAYARPWSSCA
jgi:hypothetical protein